MPQFEYKISDREGKTTTARGEAATQDAMVDTLIDGGYYVIEIREIVKPKKSLSEYFSFFFSGRISRKEITYFYMQLSTLISAGVTLVESLESLADQCENPRLRSIIQDVKVRISTGQTFFDAISKYPEVFDELSSSMIKAGETGAGLEEILSQIAKFSERDTKLISKVKSAMIYPAILSIVATMVVIFLITYVFPKFAKVFAKAKTVLPAPTVFLMMLSTFMQKYIIYVIIIVLVMFFIIRWLVVTRPRARSAFDSFVLAMPVYGNLVLKSSVARFTRTLGTLLGGGVPIIKSLEVCENIMSNVHLKVIVTSLKTGVAQGITLHEILRTKKLFPAIVTKIIQTGEKTGALPKLLLKASDFFEYEVELAIETVMTIIEPVLIIVMGVVIGFIAIAMFLPMFDLTSAIR